MHRVGSGGRGGWGNGVAGSGQEDSEGNEVERRSALEVGLYEGEGKKSIAEGEERRESGMDTGKEGKKCGGSGWKGE